jgi:hypothetical protein
MHLTSKGGALENQKAMQNKMTGSATKTEDSTDE